MGGVDTAPEMERMTDMRVYADQAATTSLSKTALEAMLPWMTENFGNPSALYEEGRTARDAVETAREKIAHLLHAKAKEIYFTSGGTEADNWALQMAAAAGARIGKKHIIVSAIEHHAVLNPAKSLERQGFRVTYLPVTPEGLVLPEALEAAICPDTALVSVMYANNEVGTIQPVEELAAICRMHGVWFHTDAVQAAGHVEIDLTKLQADFLSVSAHKFHGPKGCGFLYVKNGFRTESLLEGGAQEKGKRAGTENVPGIVGMAAALEESLINRDKKDTFVLELRRQVAERLLSIEGSHLNGCGVMEDGEGAAAGTDAAARHAGTAVSRADRLTLGKAFVEIGRQYGLTIRPCAEGDELAPYGADCSGCMTQQIFETALHRRLHLPPGKTSRKECACFMTADIGAYNTCGHLCRYCYANYSKELVTQNMRQHDPQSPFLIGHSLPGDVIHQAQQESWVENQLSLFDLL